MNIAVIGMGKLGAPMAACLAARGHDVIGADVHEPCVHAIQQGQPPVIEPGLKACLDQARGRLSATCDLGDAVRRSDLTFLIVPTPSRADGSFSLDQLLQAAAPIGEGLKSKRGYHVVVVTSTVMPGATRGEILPALEKHSGKRCPRDFGLCYSPEFVSLGRVIEDYLQPDFVLIGESDPRSGERLAEVHRTVRMNDPPIVRMGLANAELTKLALNTFVTTKISYANMLAEICEQLEGGDVDVVTSALGLDTRIGRKCLKGSVGYGGPCFPRDNAALASLIRRLGLSAPLPVATDEVNRRQAPRLARLVSSHLPPGGCAAVLGLAYKPDTNFVEQAQGLEVARQLTEEGVAVSVYDPLALENARKVLGESVQYAVSAADCARGADVLVVASPCQEFRRLAPADLERRGRQAVLIDCWRLLDRARFASVCRYIGLGTHDVTEIVPARQGARRGEAAQVCSNVSHE